MKWINICSQYQSSFKEQWYILVSIGSQCQSSFKGQWYILVSIGSQWQSSFKGQWYILVSIGLQWQSSFKGLVYISEHWLTVAIIYNVLRLFCDFFPIYTRITITMMAWLTIFIPFSNLLITLKLSTSLTVYLHASNKEIFLKKPVDFWFSARMFLE